MSQTPLFSDQTPPTGIVECLGMRFSSDEERRAYFIEKLREKLRDPEFRKVEGFPIGSDEDILALSDPPYYTACPNPFVEDFVRLYGTPYDPSELYKEEPFATDVSEGKNDSIYNAHSYHTKVPHKAIMRYILHYTKPGDIVFDGFCGTGMTGVAAQMCANPDLDFKLQIEQEWEEAGWEKPDWGARYAILGDLSPAATFIAYNYNTPINLTDFERQSRRIIDEVETEYGWMYKTVDDNDTVRQVNFIVWSDVFICPNCGRDIVFFERAVDQETGRVQDNFSCKHCQLKVEKSQLGRKKEIIADVEGIALLRAVQQPVLVNYNAKNGREMKIPSEYDFDLISRIQHMNIPGFIPGNRIDRDIDIWYERDYRSLGVFTISDFFTVRNLANLSLLYQKISQVGEKRLRLALTFGFTGVLHMASRMSRFRYDSRNPNNTAGGTLAGTLYIPSISKEARVTDLYERKVKQLRGFFGGQPKTFSIITTESANNITNLPDNCIDYIFIDPPFGSNIIYSDLSLPWESWLLVSTNLDAETVIHRRKQNNTGTIETYRHKMSTAFMEAFRILKPGRWMTVEFSNTQASIWNSIQTSLEKAGFIVANVAALDKRTGSFKAVTTPTAVKQDLVISCYKPNGGLEDRFRQEHGSEVGAWDFIRSHLRYLPTFQSKGGQTSEIVERTARILYDRLVAYFVRHGYAVPLSAQEFQAGLRQRFAERDGMYFLSEQVAEYERKRLNVRAIQQLEIYVTSEESAIQWIRQQLTNKPQTIADLTPPFMRELNAWPKHERLLELRTLLEENFLSYTGATAIPAQVVTWMKKSSDLRDLIASEVANGTSSEESGALTTTNSRLISAARDRWYVPDPNRAIDLEQLRTRSLLKEFATYLEGSRKLKQFRSEAVKAGFKQAWNAKDYETIVRVAERLPESVVQEDPDLLMYYDNASLRVGR